jgi:deoxyribonuclease-4
VSIAGGVAKAIERGTSIACETVQIFLRNNLQWDAPAPTNADVHRFHQLQALSGIQPVFAHSSYLINVASPNTRLRLRSVATLIDDIARAEALRVPFIVLHPGAHMGTGEAAGLRAANTSLNEVFRGTPQRRVRIALEVTAGQGTCLGYCIGHLAELLQVSDYPNRLAVCLDTCHLHAAGYEIRTRKGYEATMRKIEHLIGRDQVVAFHLNDSKKPLGDRADRHEHIGSGHIGLEPFAWLLNDPRWHNTPMVLETPKESDNRVPADVKNLRILRSLLTPSETSGPKKRSSSSAMRKRA